MRSGIAILTTSSGSATILSPFSENMTTTVKRSATSVMGLSFGMNFSWYQRLSFSV